MVSSEIEKPSTWSIGKILGLIAIILLVIGPFLPYVESEYNRSYPDDYSRATSIPYFNYHYFGLFMFLPAISAFVLAILLYMRFDLILETRKRRINFKPIILIIGGFWFFLTYTEAAYDRYNSWDSGVDNFNRYPGIGLWMMVTGFFLCFVIGLLEWKFPSIKGLGIHAGNLAEKEDREAQL